MRKKLGNTTDGDVIHWDWGQWQSDDDTCLQGLIPGPLLFPLFTLFLCTSFLSLALISKHVPSTANTYLWSTSFFWAPDLYVQLSVWHFSLDVSNLSLSSFPSSCLRTAPVFPSSVNSTTTKPAVQVRNLGVIKTSLSLIPFRQVSLVDVTCLSLTPLCLVLCAPSLLDTFQCTEHYVLSYHWALP